MSWTASIGPVLKYNVHQELENLYLKALNAGGIPIQNITQEEADKQMGILSDQVRSAISAAIELLKTVPGPYVYVHIGGHCNGLGWNKGDSASDFITVAVTQSFEELQ